MGVWPPPDLAPPFWEVAFGAGVQLCLCILCPHWEWWNSLSASGQLSHGLRGFQSGQGSWESLDQQIHKPDQPAKNY